MTYPDWRDLYSALDRRTLYSALDRRTLYHDPSEREPMVSIVANSAGRSPPRPKVAAAAPPRPKVAAAAPPRPKALAEHIDRAQLIARRPDPATIALLETATIARVRSYVESTPRRLTPEAKAALDARMGLTRPALGVRDEGRFQVFGVAKSGASEAA